MYNIESISEKLIECVTDLLNYFDIGYIDSPTTISFPCPIHGGDNEFGSSILKKDIGNWQCYTQQCHTQYGTSSGGSILHFLQALLSVTYDKPFSFPETLEWAANFVGESENEEISHEDLSRTKFIQLCKYINRSKISTPVFTPRKLVKSFLTIPAQYYLDRGYSKEILLKFDIGYCHNTKKPFYDRIVSPFYDDAGEFMVGCSGRSRFERCSECNFFHNPTIRCPITRQEKILCAKWKHNSNFDADNYLYNYWNARKYIIEKGIVILVEGPGDVWRIEESGIYNSVALLGAKLSPGQQSILECSGAINIIVATDNDESGNKIANRIQQECKNTFNVVRLKYPKHDPGSLTIEQVKNSILPIMERI
jgi:5S rRNA maturation endonuclease (ribonuclease M5)